jgi:uncharacterized protein (TIGR02246 family)
MTRRTAVALLGLVLALPLPAFAQAGGDLSRGSHSNPLRVLGPRRHSPSAQHAQVAKVGQAWEKAYNAGDAAAVAALYTPDAQLMVPAAEPGSGPKAVQKLIAGDMALGGKLTLKTGDIVGFGDYALETGSWVANSPDGKSLDHGPYLTLYKKADGGWKIHRDIWNSSRASK